MSVFVQIEQMRFKVLINLRGGRWTFVYRARLVVVSPQSLSYKLSKPSSDSTFVLMGRFESDIDFDLSSKSQTEKISTFLQDLPQLKKILLVSLMCI